MIYLEAMSWIFITMQSPFLPVIKLPMQGVLSGKRRKEVTSVNRGGERAARTAESAWWGNCTKLVVTFRLTSRVLDCKREMKILTLIYLGTRGRETFNLSLQFLFLSLYLLHSFGMSSPKCQGPKGSFWCQQLPNPNLSVHKGLARIAQSQEEFFLNDHLLMKQWYYWYVYCF